MRNMNGPCECGFEEVPGMSFLGCVYTGLGEPCDASSSSTTTTTTTQGFYQLLVQVPFLTRIVTV